MESFIQDLRYGFRSLLRHPLFTVVAITTLAIGIGANTAILSLVNAVILRPLPFRDPERLVLIWASFGDSSRTWLSTPEFEDVRNRSTTFTDIASITNLVTVSSLSGGIEAEEVRVAAATSNTFDVLGVQPQMGRAFTPAEDQ